ncbi:MAG: hypothetical protein ACRDYY_08425 [Acidimicrobiales bacterium]
MPHPLAPPPVTVAGRRVVAPDVERVNATLRFDAAAKEAEGLATVDFLAGKADGRAALDLRQTVEWARLDGKDIKVDDFAAADVGAGKDARMRILDFELEAGSRHRLEVGYALGRPDAEAAEPIGWGDGGVRFDFWMSDLYPGRYLEMWAPAPLVHDRFTLSVDVEIHGSDKRHALIANTAGVDAATGGRRWSLCYPAHFSSLSPMLVLCPAEEVEIRRSAVRLPGRERSLGVVCARDLNVDVDLGATDADVTSWLVYLASRYGPWFHGDTFWAYIWEPRRGMEYDGATSANVEALEHEVFHSWFGRGVKPASAADGWMDEAWTTWATATKRSSGDFQRFAVADLGLDEPPVELYPQHPWSRHTPRAAYTEGARLFAGIAALMGGAGRMRSAMADWYRANAGGAATTNGLAAHLTAWSGIDVAPWWARYVHGRG